MSHGIVSGRLFEFIGLILILVLVTVFLHLGRSKKYLRDVRPLPAIEAIPEAVGRCAETGRILHFCCFGDYKEDYASMVMAAQEILARTVQICGDMGVKIHISSMDAPTLAATEDIVRTGYQKAGKPEMYDRGMVHYVGGGGSWDVSIQEYFLREKPGSSLIFGALRHQCISTLGAGAMVGALQIGGTPRIWYQGHLLAMCDYTLIAEELYAAPAYISKYPASLGTLAGQDFFRLYLMALLVISAILVSAGTGWWTALLKL